MRSLARSQRYVAVKSHVCDNAVADAHPGSRWYAPLALNFFPCARRRLSLTTRLVEEADEDNMEEIDTDNIIEGGRRTRGKTIDFAKANEEAGNEEYDEDEDEDFEDPDATMQE